MKCAGLSDDDLRRRTTPSSLSLLGLVRHMAEVERAWFRRVLDGQDVPLVWSPEGTSRSPTTRPTPAPAEAFAAWQAEIAHARDIEAAAPSLDVAGVDRRSGEEYSLRRILNHLIQEYARHNGHADFIREGIDGVDRGLTCERCQRVEDLTAVEARTLLARAFVEDPLMRWGSSRTTRTRPHACAAIFGLFAEQYLAGGRGRRRPSVTGRSPWRCGAGPAPPQRTSWSRSPPRAGLMTALMGATARR